MGEFGQFRPAMIRPLVPFLFFCSGATALVYEVIWSRYLGLMFGSTIQAQTVVLAVFMGGLALGNRVFGKRSDHLRQPLAVYGYVEILIGLYAFFFHNWYGLADQVFVKAGTGLLDHRGALLVLKSVLAVGLLLAPTLLMGGTLPLLAAWLQRSGTEAGRLSATFYAINSLGAVAGSFLGGFVLVRELGLLSAVQATALLNVLIGVTAIGVSRRNGDSKIQETPIVRGNSSDSKTSALTGRRVLIGGVLVAMTGGVSMGLEVVSSRLLALVFGGSLQAFAIMLMAFILGIGLGSALIATRRAQRWQKSGTTAWLLIMAAAYIGLFVFNMERVTVAYVKARGGLAPTPMGFLYHQILVGGISMIVLGFPAALVGATVPLWIQVLSETGAALGNRVGRLLTWNTLGAVVGVIVTGFVLMPMLGLRGSLGLLASLLAAIGGVVAWTEGQKKLAGAGIGVLALLGAVMAVGGENWRQVFSYGVFRYRNGDQIEEALKRRRQYINIRFYEDAADATVSVESSNRPSETNQFVLRINGKPDASTKGDLSTQYLVAHLPLMALPDAKDVFMLGFGSGITGGAVLGHPIEQLVLAENCAPVLRAGGWFEPWNRGVLSDRRTRLRNEDARTVLKLSPQLYDVVICEPSNPWVAGVGNVFSREFYELAAGRLKPGGIVAQWFHIYEVSDDIVFMVLRTFNRVFPAMEIWETLDGDIILLGALKPWPSSPEIFARGFAREQPGRDMKELGIRGPEMLWTRQVASQRTAHAITGAGPVQSDFFPVLDFEAPKAFYIGRGARDLFDFDERTQQLLLAAPAKNPLFEKFTGQDLDGIFAANATGNLELRGYLRWRFTQPNGDGGVGGPPGEPLFPTLFRTPGSFGRDPILPPDVLPDHAICTRAFARIYADPDHAQASIQNIEDALGRVIAAAGSAEDLNWDPALFAGIAAKALIRSGDVGAAKRLLALGLKVNPRDPKLHYLERIIERR